jgi:nucleoside-diphosphate-sugar epimerase
MATVLVTGGSGFVGSWCIVQLLQQGHQVRTTVRDLKREPEVREAVGSQTDSSGLQFAVADLSDDAGWAEAVAGCEYVLHIASPFPPEQPKDPDELIVPARDGAVRVIKAALDADVERVVMTSSVAAVRHPKQPPAGGVYSEADWTDPDDTHLTPYTRSKTIAELAAWDLVKQSAAESKLTTIQPGAIIGPPLSKDASYSLQAVSRLLEGVPAAPRLGFSYVDVRDVADLHIRAMTAPEAGGERYLAVDEFLWMLDVSKVLRDRLGDRAKKAPTRNAPNLMLRVMALFDPAVRAFVGDLGVKAEMTSKKARTELGWEPRPVEDSIAETGEALIAHGVV